MDGWHLFVDHQRHGLERGRDARKASLPSGSRNIIMDRRRRTASARGYGPWPLALIPLPARSFLSLRLDDFTTLTISLMSTTIIPYFLTCRLWQLRFVVFTTFSFLADLAAHRGGRGGT